MHLLKAIFIGILAANLAFGVWLKKGDPLRLPLWRRVIFAAGIFAIGAELVLFALSINDFEFFLKCGRFLFPSFLFATGCILAGRGAARWGLLSLSISLFLLNFFGMLSV
jgi:hypothetical protein